MYWQLVSLKNCLQFESASIQSILEDCHLQLVETMYFQHTAFVSYFLGKRYIVIDSYLTLSHFVLVFIVILIFKKTILNYTGD